MKKLTATLLISSMLLIGTACTADTVETTVETIPSESMEVISIETLPVEPQAAENEYGWSFNMTNYSELPDAIQEVIRGVTDGDYENSVYYGSQMPDDDTVIHAFLINIDGIDYFVQATEHPDGEPTYEMSTDIDGSLELIGFEL